MVNRHTYLYYKYKQGNGNTSMWMEEENGIVKKKNRKLFIGNLFGMSINLKWNLNSPKLFFLISHLENNKSSYLRRNISKNVLCPPVLTQ